MLGDSETAVLAGLPQEQREALVGLEPTPVAAPPPEAENVPEETPAEPAPVEPVPEPVLSAPAEAVPPVDAPTSAEAPQAPPPPEPAPAPEPPTEKFPWREFRKMQRRLAELDKPPAPIAAQPPPASVPPVEQPPVDDDPLGIKAAVREAVRAEVEPLRSQQTQMTAEQQQQAEMRRVQNEEATWRTSNPNGQHYDDAAKFLIQSARDEYEQTGTAAYQGSQLLAAAQQDTPQGRQVRAAIEQAADTLDVSDEEAAAKLATDLYIIGQRNMLIQGAAHQRKSIADVVWSRAVARGYRAPEAAPTPAPEPTIQPAAKPAAAPSRIDQARKLNQLGPSLGGMQSAGPTPPSSKADAPPATRAELAALLRQGVVNDAVMTQWDKKFGPNWEENLA